VPELTGDAPSVKLSLIEHSVAKYGISRLQLVSFETFCMRLKFVDITTLISKYPDSKLWKVILQTGQRRLTVTLHPRLPNSPDHPTWTSTVPYRSKGQYTW
jgi:hypothetical protein